MMGRYNQPVRCIGFIANPKAKYHLRHPKVFQECCALLGERCISERPDSFEALNKALIKMREKAVDLLVISGGDGTNGVTLSQCHKIYSGREMPPVAFIRGGTMNTVANSLGVPNGTPAALLSKVLSTVDGQGACPKYIDQGTIEVNGRLGFLFGIGAAYDFLQTYYEAGGRKAPTPVTGLKVLTKTILGSTVGGKVSQKVMKERLYQLAINGETLPEKRYIGMLSGSVRAIGFGLRPFTRAYEREGYFHLVALYNRPLEIGLQIVRMRRGLSLSEKVSDQYLVNMLEVGTDEGNVRYTLDGDLFLHDGKLRATSGPKVRILLY
jgi:diacylglycerol kinase family enzyme